MTTGQDALDKEMIHVKEQAQRGFIALLRTVHNGKLKELYCWYFPVNIFRLYIFDLWVTTTMKSETTEGERGHGCTALFLCLGLIESIVASVTDQEALRSYQA